MRFHDAMTIVSGNRRGNDDSIALVLVVAFMALSSAFAVSGPGEMCIAAWNLDNLKDSDGVGCVGRIGAEDAVIADRLSELDADIVALQEVENAAAHRA